jgi:hypothetical protein
MRRARDIKPVRTFVVGAGDDHYLRSDGVEVVGVRGICELVGVEARGVNELGPLAPAQIVLLP